MRLGPNRLAGIRRPEIAPRYETLFAARCFVEACRGAHCLGIRAAEFVVAEKRHRCPSEPHMRRSWQDIDWLERTLHVRRGKTDESQREIWLNDEAFSAISQLREEAKEFFGDDLSPEWYLFFSWGPDGEPDSTRPVTTWRTAWRSMTRSIVCPECGQFQDPAERCVNEDCGADIRKVRSPITGLRFHDLRHQAITELSEGGASDETIMSIAGHINRRMMTHYSHIRKQARRAALEQLGKEISREGHNRGTVAPGMVQSANVPFSQVFDKNGGDDGTRTRDLCRDRAAF